MNTHRGPLLQATRRLTETLEEQDDKDALAVVSAMKTVGAESVGQGVDSCRSRLTVSLPWEVREAWVGSGA